MNRIPKLAVISLNSHHLFHFRTALFHSTHARKVDPRRRTHWEQKPYKRLKNHKQELLRKAEYDHVEFCPYLSHESSRPRNRGNGWSEEFSGARDDSKRARSRARKQGFPFYEDEEEDGPKFWGSQWNSSAHYKYKRASWFDEEEAYDDSQSSSWSKSHTSSESQRLEIDLSKDRIALGLSGSGPLTLEHVKKAYRDCALKWHPDRHDGPSKVIAEEKFKACNSAYQSLCDNLGAN